MSTSDCLHPNCPHFFHFNLLESCFCSTNYTMRSVSVMVFSLFSPGLESAGGLCVSLHVPSPHYVDRICFCCLWSDLRVVPGISHPLTVFSPDKNAPSLSIKNRISHSVLRYSVLNNRLHCYWPVRRLRLHLCDYGDHGAPCFHIHVRDAACSVLPQRPRK